MPYKSNFNSLDEYYSVLLHEIAHWTGHKSRLNRDAKISVDKKDLYAFEELVAELSSMFLSAHFGINFEPTEQNATYLNSWLKALKGDASYIWKAAKFASEAVNYCLQAQDEIKQAA
jgi:antirestriction protein ArdC